MVRMSDSAGWSYSAISDVISYFIFWWYPMSTDQLLNMGLIALSSNGMEMYGTV